ncbi:hypothetical protein ACIA5H_35255 [Nocardia sp. NPDC051900]|uniref:hypothetical protein n=1 Tax=Nocardia sp. NPDC051900 TaxID=3364326 RepID=UPI00379B706A
MLLGDDALERVCENERPGPVVDYRSTKTAVEVKAVKHGQFEQLRATYTKKIEDDVVLPVSGLRKTWFVMPDATAATGERSAYNGTLSLQKLEIRLGPLLLELERQGIDDALTAPRQLQWQIAALLHGGSCSTFESSEIGPGILLAGYLAGHSRPLNIDRAVRDRIQNWLDTNSSNMVASLYEEAGVRCGVLVIPQTIDGFSLTRSLTEDFKDLRIVPAEPLSLPNGVDTVITVAGDHAIQFTPPNRWTRIELHHDI